MSVGNADQVPEIFFDRKKQVIILNMIEHDCIQLFGRYGGNKDRLKEVIEMYEEFIHAEINSLFDQCNSFIEIVQMHGNHFMVFMGQIDNGRKQIPMIRTEGPFVIFITVQEWLLQGPKGHRFYTMVDIDSFKFYPNWSRSMGTVTAEATFDIDSNTTHMNGSVTHGKIARLTKYGKSAETILAFQNNQQVLCDAATTSHIRQVQAFLKSKCGAAIDGIPNKCAHLLLPKLFYGLEVNSTKNKVQISINNRQYTFQGDGPSTVRAKNFASQRALQKLCVINAGARKANPTPSEPIMADIIEKMVMKLCSTFPCFAETKKNRRNVISAIIQTSGDDSKSAKVIVLATGTKGIDAENMHREGTVHDTHAEVVARRSLMLYFYDQLKMLCDESSQEIVSQSIFTRQSSDCDARYKLKDGIRFHLFTSRGPCGDATAYYCKNHSEIGKLRVKVENKEGYKLVDEIKGEKQLFGAYHEGAELYTATCSDKIARWNVVGVQGALLSRIIEPIYLDTIIMSPHKNYAENVFIRAFYGRIEGSVSELPPSYRHNHSRIAFASTAYKRDTHEAEASHISINWVTRDYEPEKIISRTGLAGKGPDENPSRISKMELMKRFVDVMTRLPRTNADTEFDSTQTYHEMKEGANDYNIAKQACIEAFQAKNLGSWTKVQKPSEIEKFTL